MAWEWSHTVEAYIAARRNLETQPNAWLARCYAEWHCTRKDGAFSNRLHDMAERRALRLIAKGLRDAIVNEIWEHAESLRTCDNGGFNAYMCPDGCHTVSFSGDATEDTD